MLPLDEVAAFVDLCVDGQGDPASRMLGNADHGPAPIHISDDPVAVVRFIGEHCAEFDALDQRSNTEGVEPMSRHQHTAHQVAKRICQRRNSGGPAALRLTYRLTLSQLLPGNRCLQ